MRSDLGAQRVDLLVIEAGRRLVEQQQFGLARERAGEFDALLGAEGQFVDRPIGDAGEPEFLDERARALAIRFSSPSRDRQAEARWRESRRARSRACRP